MSSLNYARMPGPGDFSPADEPEGFDDTDIRSLLESSPAFVAETMGEHVDWAPIAQAWIAGDAIEVSRLIGSAVLARVDESVAAAAERFDSNPANNRHNPDGDIDPWRQLERDYGAHLKRTPTPEKPRPLDLVGFANALMGGDQSGLLRALGPQR